VTIACTVLTVINTVAIAADSICREFVIVTITNINATGIGIGIGNTLAMTLILVWVLKSVTSKAVILTVWM
jgi:hypothetical protein